MPKPYPSEFREDVVRAARSRRPNERLADVAAGFGISETCLVNWLKAADVEAGVNPGVTAAENAEVATPSAASASSTKKTRPCGASGAGEPPNG